MAVNQERVNVVCTELASAGKKPTLATVRDALREGSYSTIGPMVQKWKAGQAEIAGGDVVAVSVPDALQLAGGRMLAEVWAMAERLAAERLAAERAAMDAERAEVAAELEAAYADMETLREQLAKVQTDMELMAEREKAAFTMMQEREDAYQTTRVQLSAASAEAAAYKLAIEKFNPQVNQEQPKKPAQGKKTGKAIAKGNDAVIDTRTQPLVL